MNDQDVKRCQVCGVVDGFCKCKPAPVRSAEDVDAKELAEQITNQAEDMGFAEAAQLIEADRAAQRQAGREEARRELAEGYAANILELDKRYAELVEASKIIRSLINAIQAGNGKYVSRDMAYALFMYDKALRDQDEAKGGSFISNAIQSKDKE